MKRVYIVLEDKHGGEYGLALKDEDFRDGYDGKLVDVYDNFPAARNSIRIWAESYSYTTHKSNTRVSETIMIIDKNSPYSNDDKIFMTRYIVSTLLKSS